MTDKGIYVCYECHLTANSQGSCPNCNKTLVKYSDVTASKGLQANTTKTEIIKKNIEKGLQNGFSK